MATRVHRGRSAGDTDRPLSRKQLHETAETVRQKSSPLKANSSLDPIIDQSSAQKADTFKFVRRVLQGVSRQAQDFVKLPYSETSFEMMRSCQQDIIAVIDCAVTKLVPEIAQSMDEIKPLYQNGLDAEVADSLRQCLATQEERAQSLRVSLEKLSTDMHVSCVEEAKLELEREPSPMSSEDGDTAGMLASFRNQAHAARRRSLEDLILREKNRTHQLHGFIMRHMKECMKDQFTRTDAEMVAMQTQAERSRADLSREFSVRNGLEVPVFAQCNPIIIKAQFDLIRNTVANVRSSVAGFRGRSVEELREQVQDPLQELDQQVTAGILLTESGGGSRDMSTRGNSNVTSARSGDAAAGGGYRRIVAQQQSWPTDADGQLSALAEEMAGVSAEMAAVSGSLASSDNEAPSRSRRSASPAASSDGRLGRGRTGAPSKRTAEGRQDASMRARQQRLTPGSFSALHNALNGKMDALNGAIGAVGSQSRQSSAKPADKRERTPSPAASAGSSRRNSKQHPAPTRPAWGTSGKKNASDKACQETTRLENKARSRESSPAASSCSERMGGRDPTRPKASPARPTRVMRDAHYPRGSSGDGARERDTSRERKARLPASTPPRPRKTGALPKKTAAKKAAKSPGGKAADKTRVGTPTPDSPPVSAKILSSPLGTPFCPFGPVGPFGPFGQTIVIGGPGAVSRSSSEFRGFVNSTSTTLQGPATPDRLVRAVSAQRIQGVPVTTCYPLATNAPGQLTWKPAATATAAPVNMMGMTRMLSARGPLAFNPQMSGSSSQGTLGASVGFNSQVSTTTSSQGALGMNTAVPNTLATNGTSAGLAARPSPTQRGLVFRAPSG